MILEKGLFLQGTVHVLHAHPQHFTIEKLSQTWSKPFEHRLHKTHGTADSKDRDQNRFQENVREMSKMNTLSTTESHFRTPPKSSGQSRQALDNISCCPICPLSITFAKEYWQLEDNNLKFEFPEANIKVEASYQRFDAYATQANTNMEVCHAS